ncbi:MAG: hypothetical protein AAF604_08215 [Acidobacteriota bacterium]
MRALFTFSFLVMLRLVSGLLFRVDLKRVGEIPPGDPWQGLRVVAILNHTSLYEPIFAGGVPLRFLRRLADHGVIPIAAKTIDRPITGRFFRALAAHVVSISRQRDETWSAVLGKIDDPKAMVALLPEGRMKRANGLDSKGRPMTVRGGIADILQAVPKGRLLLAYSLGLHHVQVPGQRLPRLFQKIRMRLEVLEIADYRAELEAIAPNGDFRAAVIADLTRRRDLYCNESSDIVEQPL